MTVRLTIHFDEKPGEPQVIELDDREIVIGRMTSCTVPLPHPMVSRTHVSLTYEENRWRITDQSSKMGTRLNGEPLPSKMAKILDHNDVIRLPQYEILFEIIDEAEGEHTQVMAKRLFQAFFHGQANENPSFIESLGNAHLGLKLFFQDDKNEWSLGKNSECDFFVDHASLASKHLSFIRDVHGLWLIPLPERAVLLDQKACVEPTLLLAGQVFQIGELFFRFVDPLMPKEEKAQSEASLEMENKSPQLETNISPKVPCFDLPIPKAKKSRSALLKLDRVWWVLSGTVGFASLLGFCWVFFLM